MMDVGVFTVDAQGRFVAWSAGAQRITGYSHDEVAGQPCRLLEGPNCKGFGVLADLLRSPQPPAGGICNQECKVAAKDGQVLTLKYKDGEKKIIVPDGIPIVAFAPGNVSDLKPGAKIFVGGAKKLPDGTLETGRVNVGKGTAPPM